MALIIHHQNRIPECQCLVLEISKTGKLSSMIFAIFLFPPSCKRMFALRFDRAMYYLPSLVLSAEQQLSRKAHSPLHYSEVSQSLNRSACHRNSVCINSNPRECKSCWLMLRGVQHKRECI